MKRCLLALALLAVPMATMAGPPMQAYWWYVDNETDFDIPYVVDGAQFIAGAHTEGGWVHGEYPVGGAAQVTFVTLAGQERSYSAFDGQHSCFAMAPDGDIDLFTRN